MAKTKSSSSSSTGSGPTGTLIGPPAKAWRVGRELGRGACGSVHEIARDASASSSSGKSGFVVKIAALPPAASATAARSKKRKKTPQERNADLLYQENVYYRNVLNDLRGTVVPEVPHPGEGGPPGYGDIDGKSVLAGIYAEIYVHTTEGDFDRRTNISEPRQCSPKNACVYYLY